MTTTRYSKEPCYKAECFDDPADPANPTNAPHWHNVDDPADFIMRVNAHGSFY